MELAKDRKLDLEQSASEKLKEKEQMVLTSELMSSQAKAMLQEIEDNTLKGYCSSEAELK